MDRCLYCLALAIVKLLQWFPLRTVARLGRVGGALAYWLDLRHRRVALRNLQRCFGAERSPAQLRALARENFRRIGENYCSAVKTAAMTWPQLQPHCQFVGAEKMLGHGSTDSGGNVVGAIGHFGNFELYARWSQHVPTVQCATTYRGLPHPALDRLLHSLRIRSGCLFFERRTQVAELKAAMSRSGLFLGLLADQHAGRGGALIPFFGHLCSTSIAPAVFALRYRCPLFTVICYRVALAQWRIEVGDEIPTRHHGRSRPVTDITRDINRAFEAAIRRDPANWFWVHNRWKTSRSRPSPDPEPAHPTSAQPAT